MCLCSKTFNFPLKNIPNDDENIAGDALACMMPVDDDDDEGNGNVGFYNNNPSMAQFVQ